MSAEPLFYAEGTDSATVIPRPELRTGTAAERSGLVERIRQLGPWHMDIELTEDLSTGMPYSPDGEIRDRSKNLGMTLLSFRRNFLERLDQIYPAGLADKTLLDCACNAGGYGFWATERNLKAGFGFDPREHWIRQARFIKSQRRIAPTHALRFGVCELADLYKWQLELFDVTLFKGIFCHVADPVAALRTVANLTRETIIVNTPWLMGQSDGQLKMFTENTLRLMNGVDGIKWLPTGPRVVGDLLKWLGFTEQKLVYCIRTTEKIGRMEIVASRRPGLLENLPADPV